MPLFGKKASIPGKIDDIVARQDIRLLLTNQLTKLPETRMIVVITLDDQGKIETQYAGVGGDISACGMITYGLRIVQNG